MSNDTALGVEHFSINYAKRFVCYEPLDIVVEHSSLFDQPQLFVEKCVCNGYSQGLNQRSPLPTDHAF